MLESSNNNFIDFLLSRRSVKAADLCEPGPNKQQINKIIEVGLRVPDHGRCSPWKIQILNKEAQEKLGKFYIECFKTDNAEITDTQKEFWLRRPQLAPVLFIVSFYPNYKKNKIPLIEQKLSCGALCQNILNASHAFGFGGQWITEWPAYNNNVKLFLGHNKEAEIVGFIYIGSAKTKPTERPRAEPPDIAKEWL